MFAPRFDSNKLKTNLRISGTRLKNLYKKKNELNVRARRELAEYLKAKKIDRARIRVEQIVREDYLLEVLEIIELYCELLTTRLGLITSTAECDPGLKEAIATIIWVTPRLSYDCPELEVLKNQFSLKYGKEFALACATNSNHDVNAKVMHKLNVKAPPANLCEAYLVEIARSYDVEFTPDENLLNNTSFGGKLVDLGEPPSLPPYDLMSSDFLDAEKTPSGPGAPYPVNTGASAPSAMDLPSIPGESGQQFHDFKGPEAPPPYQHPDDASGTKLDDEDEKKASGGSGPLPPPTTDDDDFDALSARFNNLRKDK
uniref:IST1 homolog n=1 Tax=Mesocestoides corti TaxID=53468 RepID=A0A5K3EUP8_MESCO